MRALTWSWITCAVVMVALLVTVPVSEVGCSGGDPSCESSDSIFGLIHQQGSSDDVLGVYKFAMLAVLVLGAGLFIVDRRQRRQSADR